MKRMIGMLLAALLALGAWAGAEEAVVTFASFDGGGHEYTVEIGDPSILACEVTRDYGGDDPELVDGASFDVICTFTGLAPGSTDVAISGRSPILENDDALYTATVDEALNVTLTPVRALSTFFLYRGGEIYRDSYRISRGPEGYLVSVSDGEPLAIDAASVAALERVVEDYDLARWDGFDESEPNVLDGEGFTLRVEFADGGKVYASGENHFPRGYWQAVSELTEVFGAYLPER